MADNYLEKKMEDFHARNAAKKAKEERARQRMYKKRMDAYRKRLEAEAAAAGNEISESCSDGNNGN